MNCRLALPDPAKVIMSGCRIAAGGAFIHQKQLAHFITKTGYKDPELGDLLIVCREKRFSDYCYNSMLLQAKRTSTPLQQRIPNDHQYVLYSEWPKFEFRRADPLTAKYVISSLRLLRKEHNIF